MPARSTVSPNAAPIWSSLQILVPPTMSQRASVINGTPTARRVMVERAIETVERGGNRKIEDRKVRQHRNHHAGKQTVQSGNDADPSIAVHERGDGERRNGQPRP